jgi:hypothetical protein
MLARESLVRVDLVLASCVLDLVVGVDLDQAAPRC